MTVAELLRDTNPGQRVMLVTTVHGIQIGCVSKIYKNYATLEIKEVSAQDDKLVIVA